MNASTEHGAGGETATGAPTADDHTLHVPAPGLSPGAAWRRLRAWDEARESVPGEHLLTLLAGIALVVRPPRDPLAAAGSVVAGFALIVRSATGRDGWLAALERWARRDDGGSGFVEVAAPWPYDRRVRVTAPRRRREP